MPLGPKIVAAILSVALMFAGTVRPAFAKADFSGQTVTIVVPFARGGGTDQFARFWGPLITDHLPGKPKLRIVNEPGAGSTTGANKFYKTATNDGLTVLASSASTLFAFLLGDNRVKYDYDSWLPILIEPTGGVVYAHPSVAQPGAPAKFRSTRKLLMQVPSTAHLSMLLVLALDMLGEKYERPDFGKGGGIKAFHAFRDGFVNVDMQTTMSYHRNVKKLINNGEAVPIFSFGRVTPEGSIERDPSFPELPTFEEYYRSKKGRDPSGTIYDVWKALLIAGFPSQKMLLLPKSSEPDVINAYDRAVNKVVADVSIFALTENKKSGYKPMTGKNALLMLKNSVQLNPDTLIWYRGWVQKKFDIIL